MGQHEPVNVVLPALGPLAVVLSNHRRAVPQDVGYLLKGGFFFQQPCRQGVTVTVCVGVFYARFLEYGCERPFGDAYDRAPGGYSIPEVVRAILRRASR
jgi:hypothetical protein